MAARPIALRKAELGSGTTALAAENENCELAEGSCVVKFHVPLEVVKPFPETVPVPATCNAPLPGVPVWVIMADVIKSNVNPSTDQKLGIAPELNDQGE
jgi:hypothetical protein